jgi:universal stress protein E
MHDFANILAVMQKNEEAPRLMNKLHRLADNTDCDISIIRVVYEGLADLRSKHVDVSQELKELVLTTTQKELRDAIENAGIEVKGVTSAAMWNAHTWEGVLHAAEANDADLIVKTAEADHNNPLTLRAPDDWNLLRHAKVPVLLTQPRAWLTKPTIVAAVDVYDPEHEALNARILSAANHLTHQLDGELHLVSIFPVLSKWLDEITSVQSYVALRKEIEEEIFVELADFAKEEGVQNYRPHAVEGDPVDAMRNISGLLHADLVVLGTKARTGVSGALLGNTAEKLLHALTCDVVTVP